MNKKHKNKQVFGGFTTISRFDAIMQCFHDFFQALFEYVRMKERA